MKIKNIIRSRKQKFMKKANVVGIGEGIKHGKPCITVLVTRKVPLTDLSAEDIVPTQVDNVLTDVIEVGNIKIQATPEERQQVCRPAPGGVSLGHHLITAGTLGCIAKNKFGENVILSNNHILANSNDASIGDGILQPGAFDGGIVSKHLIAKLENYVPIYFDDQQPDPPGETCNTAIAALKIVKFLIAPLNFIAKKLNSRYSIMADLEFYDPLSEPQAQSNVMDAAIAKPLDDSLIDDRVLDAPTINGVNPSPLVSMIVSKSGRTTALTTGKILAINTTVQIWYDVDKLATFDNQIIASCMSAGGDSGSLVWCNDKAVGLLFAGSEQVTIINPIKPILDAFDITIGE
jgi:hypothetical protein